LKFSIIFSFFATGLKKFKAPFHKKKFWKIPEVSEISKNKVLRKFLAIWYYRKQGKIRWAKLSWFLWF